MIKQINDTLIESTIQAKLLPFSGVRYNLAKVGYDLGKLIAAPSEWGSKGLSNKGLDKEISPHHSLNLFPVAPSSKTAPEHLTKEERIHLSNQIELWKSQNIIEKEKQPAIYFHRLTYTSEHSELVVREGFFALLAISPTGKARILPHEKTLPNRLVRQVQILHAVQMQVLPIFLLYSDPKDLICKSLNSRIPNREFLYTFEDSLSHKHEFHPIYDSDMPIWLDSFFSDKELMIADGHHRFDSLRALWQSDCEKPHATLNLNNIKSNLNSLTNLSDATACMAVYLTSSDSAGFQVGAIHRLIKISPDINNIEQVFVELSSHYDISSFKLCNALKRHQIIIDKLHSFDGHAFACYSKTSELGYIITPKKEKEFQLTDDFDQSLHNLDVSWLHHDILKRLSAQHLLQVDYEKDPIKVLHAVDSGKCDLGFFLKPIAVDDIWKVARNGLTMPPKATYFAPKIPAGLVGMPIGW